MPGSTRQIGLMLAGLGQALICLFWLPGYLLRQGIRGGIRTSVRSYSEGMAIERWKRGMLAASSRSGVSYGQVLPSGRRLQIEIQLVGGEHGLALLEARVDDERVTMFFAVRPTQPLPTEVTIEGRAALHHSQAETHLTQILGAKDGRSAHRLMRWVVALLE